jgi:hypothetical protein
MQDPDRRHCRVLGRCPDEPATTRPRHGLAMDRFPPTAYVDDAPKPRQAVPAARSRHLWCRLEALAGLRGLAHGACGNVQRSGDCLSAGELSLMTCATHGLPMNRRRTFRLSKPPQRYAKTRSTPTMAFKSFVAGTAFASAFLSMAPQIYGQQPIPCDAFMRNPNGTWLTTRQVTINGVTMGAGALLRRGVSFDGYDLATLLEERCRCRQPCGN